MNVFFLLWGSLAWGSQNQVLARNTNNPPLSLDEVPLATVAPPNSVYGVGLPDRDADHATVAINSNRDIVIAFHSKREEGANDLPPQDTPGKLWGGTMKQVELAYYKYTPSGGVDAWQHLGTKVIGGVEKSPILILFQKLVKCEKPDVIAVGDKFFVVWTRRYHNDARWPSQAGQPAVLECAWVEESGNDFFVTGIQGIGFPIDSHIPGTFADNWFEVKECGGVVDAVALYDPAKPNKCEVAVVYPHQTLFSSGGDLKRKFDLRVATCRLMGSTISVTKYDSLYENVPFNGAPAPAGEPSPGLVLPDLAPSNEKDAFWVVHERQKMIPTTTSIEPDGRIRLEYFQLLDGAWESQGSKLFKSPTSGAPLYWRRRPTISSYPKGTTEQIVSVAFGQVNSYPRTGDISANVIYEHWEHENGSLISPPTIPIPMVTANWPNVPTIWDDRPLPLQGRLDPLTWRCYSTRSSTSPTLPDSPPADLMGFNPTYPGTFDFLDGNNVYYRGIRRPAADYFFDDTPGAIDPDYFVVTWEKGSTSGKKSVYIGID